MVGGTMFFSHFMVYKKGPLSRVWLAAHWDKKLTKAHIFEICIESSVEGILQPKAKMALRTTGHLLLGVVRIYSRKAKYLLADCNEAFVKIKMAFRPGMVDLPEGNREASLAAITLPEVFHDFENMGDMTIDVDTPNTRNQCRAEEITIKEDYGTLSLMTEDAFGELAFNDPDIANDATNIDEAFDHTGLIIASEQPEGPSDKEQKETQDDVIPGDLETEGKEKETADDTDATVGCEFFGAGLFDDAPIGPVPAENQPTSDDAQLQQKNIDDTDDDLYGDFGPASVGLPSGPSSPGSIAPENLTEDMEGIIGAPEPQKSQTPAVEDNSAVSANQTTLISNDSEAFALAPLDTTVYRGMERGRSKRKRKLIVDEVKNISGEEMKNQLSDTRDIITTLDLAPPTKRLMHWKETGGVEKLFALPGHAINSRVLSRLYMRHLTTRPMDEEPEADADVEGPYSSDIELGRASKRPRLEEPDQTEIAVPEQVPLEVDQSKQLVEEPLVVPDVETENVTINKEAEDPAPKLPEMEIDNSLILPAEPSTSLLPIPEEIENLEESVAEVKEPEKEVEPRKDDVVSDLFDTLTANTGNAASTTATTTTNQMEELLSSEDAEKNDQNNILPLDDDDDVGGPASVGPPEEQLADETYEQFEERVHSKRASVMLHVMKRNLDAGYSIPFSAVVRGNKRKQVAQKFYTLLVLKKQQSVEMEQSKAYEEVYISRGPQYEDLFA